MSASNEREFAVVCATGGVGKSALAMAAAAQATRDQLAVFWVRYRALEQLAGKLTEVAVALGLPRQSVQQAQASGGDVAGLVWSHLDRSPGWVLVVDNLDQTAELDTPDGRLHEYRGWIRPAAGGLLVITSRDHDRKLWGPNAVLLPIRPLDDAEAARVLRDAAPDAGTDAEASALARRLGGHPLAGRPATETGISSTLATLHRFGLIEVPDANRTFGLSTIALHPLVREAIALLGERDAEAGSRHDALDEALLTQLDEVVAAGPVGLDADSRILGPDHPDTLTSRNNLANAYRAAGRPPPDRS